MINLPLIVKTKSRSETIKLAQNLASLLFGGAVIGLIGDLGGGKTTFVKGIAKGFKIKEKILSPTFILLKEYKIPSANLKLCHFDFYRLKNQEEIKDLGIFDYLGQKETICLIEWADQAFGLLPSKKLMIKFEFLDPKTRKIIFQPEGPRYQTLINKLKKIL
jgi:tRNA threonylcarbamoyladenosine biosynthesis protein TsaE